MKPQLARFYERATKKVYDRNVFITEKDYERFRYTERKLAELNIFPRDYAYRLMVHLREYSRDKNWKRMPIGVFLSAWAIQLYLNEIGNKTFVDISDEEEAFKMLVQEEFQLLVYCAETGTRFLDAVKILWPTFSDSWKSLYDARQRDAIRKEAFQLYKDMTGERFLTYADVVSGNKRLWT